jgi:hypothetical protein
VSASKPARNHVPGQPFGRRWLDMLNVLIRASALCAAFELAPPVSAQSPPPVQGTVAPDSTTRSVYAAAGALVAGVEHVVRYTKNLFTRGGNPGVDPLDGLREGTTVAVREGVAEPRGRGDVTPAAQGLDDLEGPGGKLTEGIVTRIEQKRKQVVIRLDDKTTETLRITNYTAPDERAAATGAAENNDALVTVYYPDENGHRAGHYFRKVR